MRNIERFFGFNWGFCNVSGNKQSPAPHSGNAAQGFVSFYVALILSNACRDAQLTRRSQLQRDATGHHSLTPIRFWEPLTKRFCIGHLAQIIKIICITCKSWTIKIFVVIVLSWANTVIRPFLCLISDSPFLH